MSGKIAARIILSSEIKNQQERICVWLQFGDFPKGGFTFHLKSAGRDLTTTVVVRLWLFGFPRQVDISERFLRPNRWEA